MKDTSARTCFLWIPFIIFFAFNSWGYPASSHSGFFIPTARAENKPEYDQIEWYVRLTAAVPSDGLMDSANTLGLDPAASFGPDLLDIPDQPRPQWVEKHLDLVFPHPEREGALKDLSSDFRKADPGKSKVERWFFEVRSNILNKEVNLSWHGPAEVLVHSQLRDGENGEILVPDPLQEGYTFTLAEKSRLFIWEYNYSK